MPSSRIHCATTSSVDAPRITRAVSGAEPCERFRRLRIVEVGEHVEMRAVVRREHGLEERRQRRVAVGRDIADAQPALGVGRVRRRHVRALPCPTRSASAIRAVQREDLLGRVARRQLGEREQVRERRPEVRARAARRRHRRRMRRRSGPGPCTGCRDCCGSLRRRAIACRAASSSVDGGVESPVCCSALARLTRAPSERDPAPARDDTRRSRRPPARGAGTQCPSSSIRRRPRGRRRRRCAAASVRRANRRPRARRHRASHESPRHADGAGPRHRAERARAGALPSSTRRRPRRASWRSRRARFRSERRPARWRCSW